MALQPDPVSRADLGVVVHQDLPVDVRDGTTLATDVYRPAEPGTGEPIDDRAPALLVRTPYDKRARDRVENQGRWHARRGYVVAIQDVRGRYESDGSFYPFVDEPEDGYDTVEWLADRPYCDGRVATMGTSYMAWVQSALATLDPPSLAAMFVNQGAANGWAVTLRHHGTFELRWLAWALTIGGGFSKRALEDPNVQRTLANVDTRDVFANEPVVAGQSPLRHVPGYESWVFDLMTAEGTDDLWESRGVNFTSHVEESADVPTVYAGGWYDSYGKATCDSFRAFADAKDSDHFLVAGPWAHGGVDAWNAPDSGEAWFGESARTDYLETRLAFFDRYLKGADSWDRDAVTYFRMAAGHEPAVATATGDGNLRHGGEWATAPDWPLPGTEFTKYYARPDGTLAPRVPDVEGASTSYEFDPSDPVQTIGGNCSSYLAFEQRAETVEELPLADRPTDSITGRGGYDQRTRPDTFGADPPYGPLEARDDVLVFRTPPLREPIEVAGPLRVRIYASTDAPDTDFTAKLIDEYPPSEDFPGGFALNLADSICRARYRGFRREPDPIEPGEVYEFELEPYPTANVFAAGHRIRLDLSSSNYPRYDVNHNTGASPGGRERIVARNTVYHDRDHPTHVELPVRSGDRG